MSQKLFYSTPPPPPPTNGNPEKNQATAAVEMEKIQLPAPSFTFRASASAADGRWGLHCLPLADRKVVCTDQSGSAMLLDVETPHVAIMPNLHRPKSDPISLFVPSADPVDRRWGGGILYVMEKIAVAESNSTCEQSDQFEAFIYRTRNFISRSKSWYGELLPPPPYVRQTCSWSYCPEITSYAVLGGGSHICISVEDTGTYCLDTASHTWSQVGKWTLPFYGKVEYVPELKLWFGISDKGRALSAADLSNMDSRPPLVGSWEETFLPEEREEWQECYLVYLGSGKFCIARFFQLYPDGTIYFDGEVWAGDSGPEDEVATGGQVTVLTGVEVVPSGNGDGNGKVGLRMIQHKSGVLDTKDIIHAVF
ncbi:hypothetical protein ACP4OV_019083 [Aristida adscensionis]